MDVHRLEVDDVSSAGRIAVETDQATRLQFDFEATDDELERHIAAIAITRPATVGILGLGYVGLPTALSLLHDGVHVVGIDVSAARLRAIRERRVDLIDADHERLAAWIDSPSFTLTDDAGRPAVRRCRADLRADAGRRRTSRRT